MPRWWEGRVHSPDGKRLAAGAMDGTVAVFDVESARMLHVLEVRRNPTLLQQTARGCVGR